MELLKKLLIYFFLINIFLIPSIASENAAIGLMATTNTSDTWVYSPGWLAYLTDGDHLMPTKGIQGMDTASHAYTQQLSTDLAYITLDLGSVITLDSLKVHFGYFRSGGSNTGYVDFKVSSDNVTWYIVKEYSTGSNIEVIVNESIISPNLSSVRYIRSSSWYQNYLAPTALYIRYYELEAIRKPTLIYPINSSALSFTYPPISSTINFTWTGENGSYNLYIAKDLNFNLLVTDTTISNNYSVQSLEAGQYWWKVRYYEPQSGLYHNWSNTNNFTLTNLQSISGTGIQGIVYELINGVSTPVAGATVYIYNTTYSNSQVIGSNGYYLFTGLENGSIYSIYATKSKYQNSAVEIINASGISTKNIIMKQSEPTVFEPEQMYVTFFVHYKECASGNCEISGAALNIYEYNTVIPISTGLTDSSGSARFYLYKSKLYTITVTNSTSYIIGSINSYIQYPIIDISIDSNYSATTNATTAYTNTSAINITYTTNATMTMQNYTNTYLTSQIGLGIMGQGILVGIINWIVVGAGGIITTIFVCGILYSLGILSLKVIVFFIISGASLAYLLKAQ